MLIDCPYCKARTQYNVVYEGLVVTEPVYGTRWQYQRQRVAAECVQCRGVVSAVVDYQAPGRVDRYHPRELPRTDFPDAPAAIAGAASEAHLCLSAGAPRGAVALARAVVEATAKAHKIKTGSLEQKINALAEKRLIGEDTREAAHEVRHYGNEVAHGDLVDVPVSLEEAVEVVALMDEILDEVFQRPARVRRVRETRKRRQSGETVEQPQAAGPGHTTPDLGQGRRAPIAAMAQQQRLREPGQDMGEAVDFDQGLR